MWREIKRWLWKAVGILALILLLIFVIGAMVLAIVDQVSK